MPQICTLSNESAELYKPSRKNYTTIRNCHIYTSKNHIKCCNFMGIISNAITNCCFPVIYFFCKAIDFHIFLFNAILVTLFAVLCCVSQKTPKDKKASLVIHGFVDKVIDFSCWGRMIFICFFLLFLWSSPLGSKLMN